MAVLTDEIQTKLEQLFVEQKTLTPEVIAQAKAKAKTNGTPLLTQLVQDKIISNEDLTKRYRRTLHGGAARHPQIKQWWPSPAGYRDARCEQRPGGGLFG
jgi:hypothetical protein